MCRVFICLMCLFLLPSDVLVFQTTLLVNLSLQCVQNIDVIVFQKATQEEQVRMVVHCCLSLSLIWGPNVSAVTTLWEYYNKNLVCHYRKDNIILFTLIIGAKLCILCVWISPILHYS